MPHRCRTAAVQMPYKCRTGAAQMHGYHTVLDAAEYTVEPSPGDTVIRSTNVLRFPSHIAPCAGQRQRSDESLPSRSHAPPFRRVRNSEPLADEDRSYSSLRPACCRGARCGHTFRPRHPLPS